MSRIKKIMSVFRSVFVSEDLFKENEEHANIVTASTMLNVFWLCAITWLLTYFDIFKIGLSTMNSIGIRCLIFLTIPAIICYIKKGKGDWVKHFLFISFTILLGMADALLKYNVTLVMVFPVILSARYYNKTFTISIGALTTIVFIISTFMSVRVGQQDINSYNLIIPNNTTITINETLRDSVTKINVDESQRLKNVFIHFFLPKFFLFNIISFACVQIAQSGKNMVKKQKEIAEKGKRIDTELNLASAIQKSMLISEFPAFPNKNEIDIYASMTPAREVGGDFYDMFLIDDNHLALCIADVSGKGIPASLVMMVSKILIKNVTMIDAEVDKALTRVNKMLCDDNKLELFITCWFGILDLRNGRLDFANAGHNPPLVYSSKLNQFEYLKSKPNMVLAGMNGVNYMKYETALEPGDKLFLYTDGVTEAINEDNKLYGEKRLKEFLNQNANLSVEDTISNLKKDIKKYVGNVEQYDDITMLELLYKGKENNPLEATKEFVANENNLSDVLNFANGEFSKYEIEEAIIRKLELAIEEIFVNISHYAYSNGNGKCTILIKNEENSVLVTFVDNGMKFNPLERQEPDISVSAEERDVGGLGIFITKKIMDDIQYEYKNGYNVLSIKKKYK